MAQWLCSPTSIFLWSHLKGTRSVKTSFLTVSIWTSLFSCSASRWTPAVPLTTSSAFITTNMTCQHMRVHVYMCERVEVCACVQKRVGMSVALIWVITSRGMQKCVSVTQIPPRDK